MQTIPAGSIDYQKNVLPPILKGRVTVNGSRAVLWAWNHEKKKFDQADTIYPATTQERNGNLIIQGNSRLLGEDSGFAGDETLVTVTVTPNAGCKDCG